MHLSISRSAHAVLHRLLGFIVVLSLFWGSTSQAANFTDLFSQPTAGGGSTVFANIMDNSGNTFIVGTFNQAGGVLSGAGIQLTPVGLRDGFVAKLNSSGQVIWARNFGGANVYALAQSVSLDPSGNVVVAGSFFGGNLTAPAVTKISATNYQNLSDALVMKLDTNGNLLWVKNFGGGSASARFTSVAVNVASGIALGGDFYVGNMTYPALTKHSVVNYDGFVTKLDTNGNLIWAQNFGGSSASTSGFAVAVDPSQNIIVSGSFSLGNMTAPSVSKIGNTDCFLMKLNSSGAIQWVKDFGGNGTVSNISAVATDSAGNIGVAGYFGFGGMSTPYLPLISAYDNFNAFAMKFNSSGTTLWVRQFGGGSTSTSKNATVGYGVALDNLGNMVVAGTFGSGAITNPALTPTGTTDAFAVELNSAGTTVWTMNGGEANFQDNIAMNVNYATNGVRSIVLSGYINATAGSIWDGAVMSVPLP